jgi:hypothetical protein
VDEKLFSLQKSYPQANIVRDPLSDRTSGRVKELRALTGKLPENITAIVADRSFALRDGKLVQNIADTLTKNGVDVVKYGKGSSAASGTASGRVVITISGHASQPLADLVATLGKAGVLKDNIVVFMACETILTRQLQMEIVEHYGAAALLAFEGEIKVSQLQPVLLEVAQALGASKAHCSGDCPNPPDPEGKQQTHDSAPHTAAPKSGFVQLLRDSMRAQGLNGFWVVSELNVQAIPFASTVNNAADLVGVAFPPVWDKRGTTRDVELHRVRKTG